ncbi:MAG: hypothetical protein NC485_10355 [Ruminococcus flavefaciens]|nr:hypothetical protein [Ruminococcus flavefaciens]MCM1059298.1 hypothetical protein [Eubacterium sp.]
MLNTYLTEEEFCKKYSPYQKGQTVNIIKSIYLDYGRYEAGTEFVIEDVKLEYGMVLPKVLSSKADNFYADERMFDYIVRSNDSNDIEECVNISYFEKTNL